MLAYKCWRIHSTPALSSKAERGSLRKMRPAEPSGAETEPAPRRHDAALFSLPGRTDKEEEERAYRMILSPADAPPENGGA